MERVDNKYINKAIDELVGFLGIKEDIPAESVLLPLQEGNTKKCIERIANHLGLPITVNLISGESFDSCALVTTDGSGQGEEGIAAQVSIPSYLPLYGSPELQGFPIQIKVSGDCQRYADAFVATVAHELSHIVLHSLLHTERNNEIYTDIAAMLLGFAMAMNRGRYTVDSNYVLGWQLTTTTRFGYMKDEQFKFALRKVRAILKSSRTDFKKMRTEIDKQLSNCRKQLSLYRKTFEEFSKLIEYLDRNQAKKIRKEDAKKIVEIHSLNYGDRFESVLKSNEKKLRETELLYSGWFAYPQNHYSKQKLSSLEVFHNNLNGLLSSLIHESTLLKNDVALLRRCVGFFGKFKAN